MNELATIALLQRLYGTVTIEFRDPGCVWIRVISPRKGILGECTSNSLASAIDGMIAGLRHV